METQRLTHGEESHSRPGSQNVAGARGFEVINKPLSEMSLKTQVHVTSLIKREHLMKAYGKVKMVEFSHGPLGLQLADVGNRVLVTAFEKRSDGSKGQAERSGKVEVGNQVVAVAGRSCLGLTMKQLLHLIEQSPRPVTVDFQPLIIPHYPDRDRETIYDRLKPGEVLERNGEPFEIEFKDRVLGLNVGNLGNWVVVSQLLDGCDAELLKPVSLGDAILSVKSLDSAQRGEWLSTSCTGLDFSEVAGVVRDAGRPVRIEFCPMRVAKATPRSPPNAQLCAGCGTSGPARAKFCWSCGASLAPAQQVGDLLDLAGLEVSE